MIEIFYSKTKALNKSSIFDMLVAFYFMEKKNIKTYNDTEILTVTMNGGSKTFTFRKGLKIFPIHVHYNPESMATILSLKDVANITVATVFMDTEKDRAIFVEINDGKIFKVFECVSGSYYFDTKNMPSIKKMFKVKKKK